MNKKKILIDLSLAFTEQGFSGIPQDSRFLFHGLASSNDIDAQGLIWSLHSSWFGKSLNDLSDQAVFLGHHLFHQIENKSLMMKILFKINPFLEKVYGRLFKQKKIQYELYNLNDKIHREQIWRTFFQSSL